MPAWFAIVFAVGSVFAGAAPSKTDQGPTIGRGNPERLRGEIPGTVGAAHGPSRFGSTVYPKQTIPLRFTHGQHLRLGLGCERCHTEIASSRRASDFNFPTGRVCDDCHGQQHPVAPGQPRTCGTCHTRIDDKNRVQASLRAPRPLLHFNHQLHAQKGATCEACHKNMQSVRLATTLQLPREADCLACHDGVGATNRCGACHPTEASGRLVTRAQDDRVSPPLVPAARSNWGAAHDLSFVTDHAGIAKANPRLCEACHDERSCTDCHAGAMRPMRIHAGDYLTTHALDARARTLDCQACHRTQSFCIGCHQRVGFGDRRQGEFAVGGTLQFHPPGWSGPPGMPQRHAQAAQANLAACTSCHTEDSCLACHATSGATTPGLDVNPHGVGFGRSARCTALASRNRRACLKCHAPIDPRIDCL
jgi:hypothetical protein